MFCDQMRPATKTRACKLLKNGGQGRNRTADASLFRAALYQLSYLAGLADCTRATTSVGLWKTFCAPNSIDYSNRPAFAQTPWYGFIHPPCQDTFLQRLWPDLN